MVEESGVGIRAFSTAYSSSTVEHGPGLFAGTSASHTPPSASPASSGYLQAHLQQRLPCQIHYVVQERPLGLGDAILLADDFISPSLFHSS